MFPPRDAMTSFRQIGEIRSLADQRFEYQCRTAIAGRRAGLVLRDPDGSVLTVVLLLEVNEIATRVHDRDAERIPVSLGRSATAAAATILAVARLIGSP